jgi:hypothetical protein
MNNFNLVITFFGYNPALIADLFFEKKILRVYTKEISFVQNEK